MPQGNLGGAGMGATGEGAAGDCTAHKEPDCVAASFVWENEYHEVILFWTIWCPRDAKPKKTWAEEPEPAMLKPAGEAGPSGVGQGSSCGFSSWNLGADTQSRLLA